MEVLLGILLAVSVLLGIVVSRIITTFIHELGHAIAALVFTKEPVSMYVGSYGDERKSIKLVFGRLSMYFSFIIWDLDMGLCRSSSEVKIWKAFVITLAGPLLSLILGIVFFYLLTLDSFNDSQKFAIAILMVSAIWDFFVNIIPRRNATILHDGSECLNDGRQALNLFQLATSSDEYLDVLELYHNNKYEEALSLLQSHEFDQKEVLKSQRLEMDITMGLGRDDDYLQLYLKYNDNRKPEHKYISHWAKIMIKKHQYDEVVAALTNLLYEGKESFDFYFLRGKALVELGEYKDAMRDFHALTLGEIEDPLALANRAYCQFRLGYEDEAVEDVLQAIEDGKSNMGEIYFLAGVVCEPKFEDRALGFYKKSLDLGYKHHALPFNISRIEKFK